MFRCSFLRHIAFFLSLFGLCRPRLIREKDRARNEQDAAADADQVLNQRDRQVMPVEGMHKSLADFISNQRAEDSADETDDRADLPVGTPGLTADHAANKSEDDAAD